MNSTKEFIIHSCSHFYTSTEKLHFKKYIETVCPSSRAVYEPNVDAEIKVIRDSFTQDDIKFKNVALFGLSRVVQCREKQVLFKKFKVFQNKKTSKFFATDGIANGQQYKLVAIVSLEPDITKDTLDEFNELFH